MKVIKIGGAEVASPHMATVWAYIRMQQLAGESVVVVHGGGPQLTKLAKELGHMPEIIQGRRVTGDLDLHLIQWIIRGQLNAQLSSQAMVAGVKAVGVSGVDGGLVRVIKRPVWQIEGREVDFGWVGDVQQIQPEPLLALMNAGFVPIVATMGVDETGQIYNVNGDTVGLELAKALGADEIILVTESGGLRRNQHDPESHISVCDAPLATSGIAAGWIQGGMLVKLVEAQKALRAGIGAVLLIRAEDMAQPEKGTKVVL
ncbi:MAG TPA: acetylglutamate kinase [Rhodothermales bacterium]|nr:acetylglutamate kinase [Bacteroidota bacterium]HRK73499.1 acetylglutamate kinase [Rhodothermales bacterium]HRR09358.1 acetylglutamate kinase [Rhodothermales bacterium]